MQKKKEAKILENQQKEKLVQQEYEKLIKRLTENKINIQRIWRILKEQTEISKEKCTCGGFKCTKCMDDKIAYIKKELVFLKHKIIKGKNIL